ncbi:metal ABC transporter solute-binding protein, Zn/Mn family [Bifidobacterium panos]|uniref:ABC transporter substrate-binding protein n=1 Tax=Bifidobacterium panos TaxID=2675321 RepID=A0ABX1SVY3_9BIFI|nr:zinc ABC transporter substrate-binding protein [Bifidobacterium sp. DSM 109963]NMN01510.1 ABC transporter substrate-binding protein [Bifidobacterium sp. DSM 109963]
MNHATKTSIAALLASALLLATVACGNGAQNQSTPSTDTSQNTGVITVVASINQWGSLASEIGGDDVEVTSILTSTNVDAHDFEPKTSDLTALSKAEIVVANGAGYDTWATKSRGSESTLVSAAQIVGASDGDNPHLWFSKDARTGMAKELANTFSKARPELKKSFTERLKDWQEREKKLDLAMSNFADTHSDATYAATESVAYYLMSDMGVKDVTPTGYAQASANGGEVAPADLQEFQKLIEEKKASVVINNSQESSDATNMITGTAGKSDVSVVDVSEQMPEQYKTLLDWVSALMNNVIKAIDPKYNSASQSSGSTDGTTNGATDGQTSSDEGQNESDK